MAIAYTESRFTPDLVGDDGLSFVMMQINTKWHTGRMEALGVADLTDPVQCAAVGLDYCQRQFEIVRKGRRNFVVFWRGVTKLSVSLLKKSVHDLLFLTHKFLAFFQAVRLTLDVDNGAVMQDTIQDGGGDSDVGKDLVPLRESFVGGKNGRSLLIPSGDELKEQVCALNIHEEITDLVNDEHPVLGQYLELVRQTVLKMGLFELLNELMAIHVGSVHISASTIRAR